MPNRNPKTATLLADRAVLRLSGEDVAGFLQGLVTSDMAGPLPAWAGLLSPQGKALFDFIVWADGEDRLIDCEASAVEALAKRLTMYRLRRAITIARDDTLGVHWRAGAGESPDPRLAALGQRWVGAPGNEDASAAFRAHRLTLGVAEGRGELGDGETLWLEANAAELNGVSFTKGCYVGQENTARMNWRAKVNRRLVVVPLARSDEKRRRAAYPELELAVDFLRVEDIPAASHPSWPGAEGAGAD